MPIYFTKHSDFALEMQDYPLLVKRPIFVEEYVTSYSNAQYDKPFLPPHPLRLSVAGFLRCFIAAT